MRLFPKRPVGSDEVGWSLAFAFLPVVVKRTARGQRLYVWWDWYEKYYNTNGLYVVTQNRVLS